MREPIYNIGEQLWYVNDYKLIKVTINEIVITIKENTEQLDYKVTSFGNKTRVVNEACLVKSFKAAKFAALMNWENIYNSVKKQLSEVEEENYTNQENNNV